jgi:transposase InsO family protein
VRKQLVEDGLDAGAATIAWHLERRGQAVPSVSTIWRVLVRRGFVVPEPKKRPTSSYLRFEATLPNERWQADMTHWRLRGGREVEILNVIDDHSRLAIAARVFSTVKGADVLDTFRLGCATWGFPASVLTDNGAIFNAESRKGRTVFETELESLGIVYKHSRPYHPQTCGKVERFHQTMKRWLVAQPRQPTTTAELQELLDAFIGHYNCERPHRSLAGTVTPEVAYRARPKAAPGDRSADSHDRVRHDVIDSRGRVTLRVAGRLHHIHVGTRLANTRVLMLVHDLEVRVVDADTGEILRALVVDPSKKYQGNGQPPGPKRP